MKKLKRLLKQLGPGFVTGAADNDPSGIATYSQTGAQFGYGQLWAAVFMFPFLLVIQETCARIGAVTGKGIPGVIEEYFNKKLLYFIVSLVCVANIINIGANIGSMAAATQLIIPLNYFVLIILYAAIIILTEVFISYRIYARYLKWLGLSLLVYPLTVLIMDQPWLSIIKATFIPHIQFDFPFLFIITGVFGTTISPYLFFWESQQVTEEKRELRSAKKIGAATDPRYIKRLQLDNFIGMFFSQITTWCIIVVAATALHTNGITNITSASDAAKALAPLVKTFPHSGYLAEVIFSIGIIGLGLLSIPVLAGSAAYGVSTTLNMPHSLNLKFKRAKGFYSIIIMSTLIGALINVSGINPFKALIFAAVLNGISVTPLLFIIALIARNKKIMKQYRNSLFTTTIIWITFIVMSMTAISLFFAK